MAEIVAGGVDPDRVARRPRLRPARSIAAPTRSCPSAPGPLVVAPDLACRRAVRRRDPQSGRALGLQFARRSRWPGPMACADAQIVVGALPGLARRRADGRRRASMAEVGGPPGAVSRAPAALRSSRTAPDADAPRRWPGRSRRPRRWPAPATRSFVMRRVPARPRAVPARPGRPPRSPPKLAAAALGARTDRGRRRARTRGDGRGRARDARPTRRPGLAGDRRRSPRGRRCRPRALGGDAVAERTEVLRPVRAPFDRLTPAGPATSVLASPDQPPDTAGITWTVAVGPTGVVEVGRLRRPRRR